VVVGSASTLKPSGVVLTTTDGGSTWTRTPLPGVVSAFAVSCPATGSSCWAVGRTAGDVVVLTGPR
jgi:hypothetical protein